MKELLFFIFGFGLGIAALGAMLPPPVNTTTLELIEIKEEMSKMETRLSKMIYNCNSPEFTKDYEPQTEY